MREKRTERKELLVGRPCFRIITELVVAIIAVEGTPSYEGRDSRRRSRRKTKGERVEESKQSQAEIDEEEENDKEKKLTLRLWCVTQMTELTKKHCHRCSVSSCFCLMTKLMWVLLSPTKGPRQPKQQIQ